MGKITIQLPQTARDVNFEALPQKSAPTKKPKNAHFPWLTLITGCSAAGFLGYRFGVKQAADIAGKKFEEFVEATANMGSKDLETFYAQVRSMGRIADVPTLQTISGTVTGVFRSVVAVGTSAKRFVFDGLFAHRFAEWTKNQTSIANFTIPKPALPALPTAPGWVKATTVGFGFGAGGTGLAGVIWSVKTVARPFLYLFGGPAFRAGL